MPSSLFVFACLGGASEDEGQRSEKEGDLQVDVNPARARERENLVCYLSEFWCSCRSNVPGLKRGTEMALYNLQGSCRLESGSFVGVQRRLPSPTEPPWSHFTSINLGCDMSVSTVGGQRTLGRCFATDHLSIACKASNGPYQHRSSAFQSNGGAAQYSFAIPHGFTVKPGFSQEFGKGLSCKCSNSFGELGSAAILEWKPALDNLLLVSSIALAYIAGIITPATPAPSVPLKDSTCSGVEEFQALPNVQGERVEEAPLWKEDIWNGARSKLIKSIDAADAMCDEISGQGVQLSLQALARGPRLRLLLVALEQLKKEWS